MTRGEKNKYRFLTPFTVIKSLAISRWPNCPKLLQLKTSKTEHKSPMASIGTAAREVEEVYCNQPEANVQDSLETCFGIGILPGFFSICLELWTENAFPNSRNAEGIKSHRNKQKNHFLERDPLFIDPFPNKNPTLH